MHHLCTKKVPAYMYLITIDLYFFNESIYI